ncbi:hypothetical protein TVAG_087970 [Trichomonas vaginalis G3]|uniref:DOCKER Lobe A domain-containing protein n=1 Tax=Trichomonas vaginalis (strain ATCC PRA-98 / G3) TaxID=412133 RepID=A2F5I9_TRIV3|nr:hypothetical protein TVAGG3_0511500 [Trichomonas vaginalis G3]EAX99815.1 hypothetical protein TVAG_087970 [Trichomonas vaginalis G3]KAI5517818.1 hypothetical protein TVAGG3_0511500 [Trichomonas vaginalis G3]|eukprot:XP_001312745.1 hypothetical protein [Trichomonas vaginalis G3]
MSRHEITTNEFQLDSRMFSQSLDDRTDAPWLTDIDSIKYSSIISEPLSERKVNQALLKADDSSMKLDDFLLSIQSDFDILRNQPILDENITNSQNLLVRPIVTPNPIIKYMKLLSVDFDYKASGLPNKVQASIFTWNQVPLTEIVQINFEDSPAKFHLFNRCLGNVVMPYTDDIKNTHLICLLKMVKDQNSVVPFAFGHAKCDKDGIINFYWTSFSNNLSFSEHISKEPLLKIKLSITISNNAHPEDKITARITPYNPMMPSPFLVIYDFHILAKSSIDNYKVKIFIKDDDENKESLYASPMDSHLIERYKSHVAFSDTTLFLPEPLMFLLNPSFDKTLTIVVTVCQEGVIMSTVKQTFTIRLDKGRQFIHKVIDGSTISFGYLYPSLIAPNAELRLPMQMPGVPPQFDSTVFDDLWPYILLRNLNSSKFSLNFLSVIFQHIPQDKISNFADRYFYCSEEFFASFLDQMTADPGIVERIPYHLFPLLFKGLCLHAELIEVMINYICGILASEKRVQTKSAAIEMLLRMRLIFDHEEIELKLVGIIKKLTDLEKVEVFCIIFSDGNFLTDACHISLPEEPASNYNMLISLFFSTMHSMLKTKGNAQYVLKALHYLTNTLQRYGLDGGPILSSAFHVFFQYHSLLQTDPSFNAVILSLLDTKLPECSQPLFDNLSHTSQIQLIDLLHDICKTKLYLVHAFNFILRLKNIHDSVYKPIVNVFMSGCDVQSADVLSLQTLSKFINENPGIYNSKESVFFLVEQAIQRQKKNRFTLAFLKWFISLDTVGHSNEALVSVCFETIQSLSDILDFFTKNNFTKPFEKPPSTPLHLEEALILTKVLEKYDNVPEIKKNILNRLSKLNDVNSDKINSAIADGTFEAYNKAGLNNMIVSSNSYTNNSFKEIISKASLELQEKVETEINYYRIFVSGPVATALEASDFIFMGDTKKLIELFNKHFKEVKINTKLIPMFGTFQTTNIQILPVKQANPKQYEYDFMMPDEGWNDVYCIRYIFTTNTDLPSSCALVIANQNSKKQVTKEEFFKEKFESVITSIDKYIKIQREFIPRQKNVNQWTEDPVIPFAPDLIDSISKIESALTPTVSQLIHSSSHSPAADLPQFIKEQIELLKKTMNEAVQVMSQIDGLEKKGRYAKAIENCKLFL